MLSNCCTWQERQGFLSSLWSPKSLLYSFLLPTLPWSRQKPSLGLHMSDLQQWFWGPPVSKALEILINSGDSWVPALSWRIKCMDVRHGNTFATKVIGITDINDQIELQSLKNGSKCWYHKWTLVWTLHIFSSNYITLLLMATFFLKIPASQTYPTKDKIKQLSVCYWLWPNFQFGDKIHYVLWTNLFSVQVVELDSYICFWHH